MIFAIFAIVLLAAGVFGHFLVKKERRKQLARREKRLKIADGIFDESADPDQIKVRKLRPGDKGYKEPVSALQAAQLQVELTAMLQQAFVELNSFHQAEQLEKGALVNVQRASAKRSENVFSVNASSEAQSAWLRQNTALENTIEDLDAACRAASDRYATTLRNLERTAAALAHRVKALDGYDLTQLPETLTELLSVARILGPELPSSGTHSPRSYKYQKPFDKSHQSKSVVDRDMTALFYRELDATFPLTEALVPAHAAAREALAHLKQMIESAALAPPDKPTDEDVQEYLSQALAWSEAVQSAQTDVVKKLAMLKAALQPFHQKMEATRWAHRHANEVAEDHGRYMPSAALRTANAALGRLQDLDNEAFAIVAQCSKAVPSDETVKTDQTPAATDSSAMTATLKAAMRKVGFAVAQFLAAQARLTSAGQQDAPTLSHEQPTLDESNAESYLRRHVQWLKATEVLAAAQKGRAERTASLQEQLKQRKEQVPQSVLALEALLQTIKPGEPISPELEVTARAARLLSNLHNGNDKPPSAAESAASAAASQAAKDEAQRLAVKQKREREAREEEERRRRRRRNR